jgi:predicted MFS family arabinose efflux permease
VLAAAVAVEFFHRQIFAIAMPDIQRDLGLSDSEVGTMLLGFALAYFPFALLLGRLADRVSRSNLYAVSLAFWSAATAAGAASTGYVSLLLSRAGVGAGQAGAGAANAPLVADYVEPAKRGTAMGLVAIGGTLGSMVGLAAGGYGVASFGWRSTFVFSGALGVVFALLFRFVVREPPRGWSEGAVHDAEAARPSLGEVVATIRGIRTLPQLAFAAILSSMAIMTIAQWGPTFFERVHELEPTQVGLVMAVVALVGTLGPIGGGVITDRLWSVSPRRALHFSAVTSLLAFPVAALAIQIDNLWIAAGGFSVALVLGLAYTAQISMIPQALAPLRMRSLTAAVMAATLTGVGFGIGPWLTGVLSDLAGGDAQGLRIALTVTTALYAWAALHFWLASRTLEDELSRAGQQ